MLWASWVLIGLLLLDNIRMYRKCRRYGAHAIQINDLRLVGDQQFLDEVAESTRQALARHIMNKRIVS